MKHVSPIQDCEPRDDSQMLCPVPFIDLPLELIEVNSSSASRQSRPHRDSAAVAYISNENVSMSMYLGFIMDKLPSLRNISKTKPNLRLELLPFVFQCCDHTYVDFDPAVHPLIIIEVVLCRYLSLSFSYFICLCACMPYFLYTTIV